MTAAVRLAATVAATVAASLLALDAAAQRVGEPYLVSDLVTRPVSSSNPLLGPVVGGRLLFAADDGAVGREPWLTDGTPGGTLLLKDAHPGHEGSDARVDEGVHVGGGRYVFSARDEWGEEPWVTDGTADGTMRLLDIWPGSRGSEPADFVSWNGIAYFTAEEYVHGRELWKTDGSPFGTQLVLDLLPGDEGFDAPGVGLTPFGEWLYFVGWDRTLWRTDGTRAGTTAVLGLEVSLLHVLADELLLITPNPTGGRTLWKSDGSPFEQVAGLTTSPSDVVDQLGVGGELFFVIEDRGTRTLWRTDGTVAGTRDVAAYEPAGEVSLLGEVGGELVFLSEGLDALELRRSGSPSALVRRLPECAGCGGRARLQWGGLVYFVVSGDESLPATCRTQLWRTDGTSDGTELVADTPCEAGLPHGLAGLGPEILFARFEDERGVEPWITDGTAGGTRLLLDVHVGTPSSSPTLLTGVDGRLFFSAVADDGSEWLWSSDGTSGGTEALRRLTIVDIAGVRGLAVLSAGDLGPAGWELWTSDGTAGGTQVLDVVPGAAGLQPAELTEIGDFIYFQGTFNARTGAEPWTTDGTVAGTAILNDLIRGSSEPREFTLAGDSVYFSAGRFSESGQELWKTDGTWPGTELVTDVTPGWREGVHGLRAFGDDVCFLVTRIQSPRSDQGVWCSDGTPAGSRRVSEIHPVEILQAAGDTLYFVSGCEWFEECLHRSDGTEASAEVLRTFDRVSLQSVATLDGVLYFAAGDEVPGWDLWRTDGTEAGTFRLKSVESCQEEPWEFTQAHGLFFFAPQIGSSQELWMSDGTASGTRPIPNVGGFDLGQLTPSGSHVFFTLDDGRHGVEPWAIGLDPDGDGVSGADDNCPQSSNPAQADADGDGHGDACDACAPGVDADRDNACDAVDNCAGVFNPLQRDLDADGVGDACDGDADGDGAGAAIDCDDLRAERIVPAEVTNLRVTKAPHGLRFAWDDQAALAGTDVLYSLVGAPMPLRPWLPDQLNAGACLASQVSRTELDGSVVESWWFLVRSRYDSCSSCEAGTLGDSSVTPDPRDDLERFIDERCF